MPRGHSQRISGALFVFIAPPRLLFSKSKTLAGSSVALSEGGCSSVSSEDLAIFIKGNTTDDAKTPETKIFSLSGNGIVKRNN